MENKYKIASEKQAAQIGGNDSSTSLKNITKVRAINFGCSIRDDSKYKDN